MLGQRAVVDRRAAVAVDVGVVDQVGRHQVDGAFDTRELAADQPRECAQQRRLADADVALQQHVAAREHRDDELMHDARLADDDGARQLLELERACVPVGEQVLCSAQ